jgi:protein farnesyltransferase/geranylgeranyltransferase type-1 subunit alpha
MGRQWLLKHFDLSASLEVAFTTKLIEEDILNNSAWSHRYYTLFGNGARVSPLIAHLTCRVLKYAKRPLSTTEIFATEFVPPRDPDKTIDAADISVHALDVLAEINAHKNPALAKEYLEELAGKYDTMRKGYWAFRIEQLGPLQVSTSGNHK